MGFKLLGSFALHTSKAEEQIHFINYAFSFLPPELKVHTIRGQKHRHGRPSMRG